MTDHSSQSFTYLWKEIPQKNVSPGFSGFQESVETWDSEEERNNFLKTLS